MYDDNGGFYVGLWRIVSTDDDIVEDLPNISFRVLSGLSGILISLVTVGLWLV